ncbi:kinase-like domain-containing protein [Rhizophagus clarus]|uniref:Kinase-like domain-containing protein n=1 Tax=Rhizophagus clarus TaxID=94130 RepID=A0A8H3KY52_9GLOM|nr:kinase-like domain-containing protein [Rhizophagus clarus]
MVNLKSLVKVSKLKNTNHGKCSYCNKPFTEELWCKKCDPFRMIEGWTSGNNDIDKFIKDTIYEIRGVTKDYEVRFLEWVPFDKFKDIKQIGEGGFAKVYSATWIDGKAYYKKQDDGSWKKREPKSLTVALKRLNGSQNMSVEYLNELKTHWNYYKKNSFTLDFYGITKDPETKEFMMILQFAEKGNLRSSFLKDFNEKLWRDKLLNLFWISANLNDLHELKYIHKDFHTFWKNCLNEEDYQEKEEFGYKGKEVKAAFEEADKEIPNISTLYKKNPDAIYTSRLFTFNNLAKPVNSSIITSYLDDEENNEDNQDSQLVDLEVSSSLLQSKDDDIDNENSVNN